MFIDATPSEWATLETALALVLDPKPAHTGFGWIETSRVTGEWVVTVGSDETVAADVSIAPPGLPCLDIKAATPVALDADDPSGDGAVIALSHPPIPAVRESAASRSVERAWGHDRTERSWCGCRGSFELLQGFPNEADVGDTTVVKHIFAAFSDPLHPERTTFSYTGTDFVLSEVDGVFSIAAT